jgi:hypothetical protein
MTFQVKRFGLGRSKKDTEELISYLNSFPSKYSKTEENLLIVLESGTELDGNRLVKEVCTDNFPFPRIMFTGMARGKVFIGEIYPDKGYNEYDPVDFV